MNKVSANETRFACAAAYAKAATRDMRDATRIIGYGSIGSEQSATELLNRVSEWVAMTRHELAAVERREEQKNDLPV